MKSAWLAARALPGGMAGVMPGLLLCALVVCHASAAWADFLVDNVDGVSPDGKGGFERFDAFLIDEQGRVIEVYHKGEKHPKRPTYRIDGKGRFVMPGLIDGHAHVMDTGFAKLTLDLSGTRSLDEALSRVAAWNAAHPDLPWILGRGWDINGWGDGTGTLPSAQQLDAVTSSKPAWLVSADGDAGWINSAGLAAAGITAASTDPIGGRIERIGAGRQPSGILVGTAMEAASAKAFRPRPEDRDTAFGEAQIAFLSAGVTTVADMGTSIDDWQAMRRSGDDNRLSLRVVAYAGSIADMALIGGPRPGPWLYWDKLKMNGLFIPFDGSLETRGASLMAPYSSGGKGLARMNETQLGNLMSRAAIDNFQVAVGAKGDAGVRAVLDSIADLTGTYKGDRRWRLEGARLVSPDDLGLLPRNGLSVTVAGGQVPSETDGLAAQIGPERLSRLDAWQRLADTGVPLSFGSGSPAHMPRPFAAIAAQIAPGSATLTREAAFAAVTVNPARALFAEDRLGRIAKGFRADFLFVDRDPIQSSPEQLRDTRVLETWIGGQKVWSADQGKADAPQDAKDRDAANQSPLRREADAQGR